MTGRSRIQWSLIIVGVLALCALIWFVGPLIAVAGWTPLAGDITRLVVIFLVIVGLLLNLLRKQLQANRANQQLAEGMTETGGEAEAPSEAREQADVEKRSREEVAVLRERLEEALHVLRQSARKKGGNLYELPWYIIIGPPGSGKTTALVNSGLEFPLAELFGKGKIQGVGGTRNCDWWFTNDAVLLDTAGRYLTQDSDRGVDRAAWEGFLSLLKRHRRRRPINGIIVTMSLRDLMLQSEREREAHVQALRGRVQELYSHFGMRLPVYVQFTKCDLVAGFVEFFDDLGREERAQVWGFTLPIEEDGDIARFESEFDALLVRLNDRLLWRLEHERDAHRRTRVYGFPQQMATLKQTIVNFLEEVFRPTRFDERALLRGVYFTSGTQEGTPIDRAMGAVARAFGLGGQSLAAFTGQGRAYFITDVLKKVIFQEADLVGTNRRFEHQRMWLQRGAYALAILVTAGAVLAWSASYRGNLQYVARMQDKVDVYDEEAEGAPETVSSFDEVLPALDKLRATTQVYGDFADGVPLLMGLGMYQGDKLGRAAESAYLRELRRVFLPLVAEVIATNVHHAGNDPDLLYTGLKAYLMLGDLQRLDSDLIRAWLDLHWRNAYESDPRKQDRLHGHLTALLEGGLRPVSLDEQLVRSARAKLSQMPLHELAYGRLKREAEAAQEHPFRLTDAVGEAGGTALIRSSGRPMDEGIPELFTYRGFYEIFQKDSRLLIAQMRKETWVLGIEDDAFGARELRALTANITDLYVREYVTRWEELLQDVSIAPFRSVPHGLEVLETLSSRQSALKGLLQAVARNTSLTELPEGLQQVAEEAGALGTAKEKLYRLLGNAQEKEGPKSLSAAARIEREFEGLNELAGDADRGAAPVDDAIDLLARVYAYLDTVANGEEASGAVLGRLKQHAVSQPQPLKRWLQQVASHTESVTERKLAANQARARAEKRTELLQQMNTAWRAQVYPMCLKALNDRYPISSQSERDMTLRDFGKMFGPGGLIDAFFAQHLEPFVDTSAGHWRWREVDGVSLGLSDGLLAHFRTARRIRESFFQDGGIVPSVHFALKPVYLDGKVTQFQLDIEGQKFVYRHGPARTQNARWPNPDGPRQVRMFFEDMNGHRSMLVKDGPWAWFRLLDETRVEPVSAERILATFELNGMRAQYEIVASSVLNPFVATDLRQFRCPEGF